MHGTNRERSTAKPRHFARDPFWYVVLGAAVLLVALMLVKAL